MINKRLEDAFFITLSFIFISAIALAIVWPVKIYFGWHGAALFVISVYLHIKCENTKWILGHLEHQIKNLAKLSEGRVLK